MRELEDKRTRFSKTFDLGEGRRRLEIGQLPMHFERGGALHDIDLTPEFDGGRKSHAVRHCPYSLRVADDRPAYFYNSRGGKAVEVELSGVSGKPLVEGGLFKWAEVGKDTDYVIQPLPAGCSTLLILHGPDAPRKWSWRIGGDIGLIVPLVGKDSQGRHLELIERRDAEAGTIEVEWTGRTITPGQLRRERRAAWTNEVSWPVFIDPTINENIAANADDAFSIWVGSGATFYQFYGGGNSQAAGRYVSGRFYAGLRFQTIAIANTATVNSATLTVRVTTVDGSPNINIFGNDVDDAAAWADPGNRVKNITKTTAVTNKSSWTAAADNAIDVTAVAAEVIARAGWASNNDLAFGFFDNGAGTGLNRVAFAALEHATLTEARLAIDYTEFNPFSDTVGSASGSGVATAAANAIAATVANASGNGAAIGVAASIASASASSDGVATATAEGEDVPDGNAAASAAGTSTAEAVPAVVASAAGSAEGSAIATAASPVVVVEAPDYTPVGGGGGFGPPGYSSENQRFRTRKEKSKPKVITVRIGDWPEDPQIILERQEQSERDAFHRSLATRRDEPAPEPVDDEEQALMEILAFAA
jgi:hypothetical protein